MKRIHVKNLPKYHPGYTDRKLLWAKIYFDLVQGDPEFELLKNEVDKWRFVCFICLELQARKPIPLDNEYFRRKGFDLKRRSIDLTIQMLHNFLDIVTDSVTQEKSSVTNSVHRREEEEIQRERNKRGEDAKEFWHYYLLKTKGSFTLTEDRERLILKRLGEHSLEELKKAVDAFVMDDWPGRKDHLDLIYCIGKQRGKPDALEKWLNRVKKGGVRYE